MWISAIKSSSHGDVRFRYSRYSCSLIFVSLFPWIGSLESLPEIWPMLQLWKRKLLQNWCASWHVLVGKTLLKCSLTKRIQMLLYKFCEHCLAWRFHHVFMTLWSFMFHVSFFQLGLCFQKVFVMFWCTRLGCKLQTCQVGLGCGNWLAGSACLQGAASFLFGTAEIKCRVHGCKTVKIDKPQEPGVQRLERPHVSWFAWNHRNNTCFRLFALGLSKNIFL